MSNWPLSPLIISALCSVPLISAAKLAARSS
jgi:hypothetical protein